MGTMSPFRDGSISFKRIRLFSRPVIVLPLIVFIAFAVISGFGYVAANTSVESTRERVIERRAEENANRLRSTLASYTLIAQGGVGLANSSTVTTDSWHTLVGSYDLANNYPAIEGVAYDVAYNRETAQEFIAALNDGAGNPSVTLRPESGDTFPNVLIGQIEPVTEVSRQRLGDDMTSYPGRLEAIREAARTGQPVLTRQPELLYTLSDPNANRQKGFIIFSPVYTTHTIPATESERLADFQAVVHVSFRSSNFFDRIYTENAAQQTYLTIYQGNKTDADKVYEGGTRPRPADTVTYEQRVQAGGQTFVYDYAFSNSELLTQAERDRPISLLLAGLVLGGLLSIVLLFSVRTRYHRLSYEKERDVQLAKDELLSLASHQLRTPATGVKQYMGMVLQGFAGEITPQQKEFLQKAYDSNDRQLHIINDILHLAKLDAGRIVLSKTDFDLAELVRSVVEEQTASAEEGDVALKSRLPKRLAVYADAHMMRMVVENLVSNAIKYTHPGGAVNVAVRTEKGRVFVSVRDTGVGIDTGDLDKLFKQFSRIANDRSHLVSGTGVGLYLVKNLIELHGGDVSVASKPGQGTTFTIAIPHKD